jgi:predicted metal-dependent RNase
MKKITQFLERFKNIKPGYGIIEESAREIIKDRLNIKEDSFSISYNKPNLVIKTENSVLKNEIYLRKDEIINELRKKLGKRAELKLWFK